MADRSSLADRKIFGAGRKLASASRVHVPLPASGRAGRQFMTLAEGKAMPQPLLSVTGVTLQYKTSFHLVTATYRVDFKVFQSERFILLGPSGCGKSTLLKAVGGYMKPVEGTIRLNGKPVTTPGPDRVMVFQE